jgi:hypothetical protein
LGEEFDDDRVEVFTASIGEGLELGLEFGWEGDGHGEQRCGRYSYFSGFTTVCGHNSSGLARVEGYNRADDD